MTDHGRDGAMAQCEHDAHGGERVGVGAERGEVAVIAIVPTCGAAITSLIGRDRVEAGLGERRQHLAPTPGHVGEAVEQEHERTIGRLVAGFEDTDGDPVDVRDGALPYAGQRRIVFESIGGHAGSLRGWGPSVWGAVRGGSVCRTCQHHRRCAGHRLPPADRMRGRVNVGHGSSRYAGFNVWRSKLGRPRRVSLG